MKKIIRIFTLLLIVGFISCREESSKFITDETIINFDSIKRVKIDRGIMTMKNFSFRGDYDVYSDCPLIYDVAFPTWIKDMGKPDFSVTEYKFEPKISDIEAPYVVFKKRNEVYFYVIKNTDTLKFKIRSEN
jgi:hypothetical protein